MTLLPILLIGLSSIMHAGWNLLAHSQRADGALFLRVTLITGLVGLIPAVVMELQGPAFAMQVWLLLAITGIFQALYYLGLTMGYRSGDFTLVYPLARALPVLFLAVVDLARGRMPTALGWLGMALVMAGCALAPLESLRGVSWAQYRKPVMVWVLVTALGTLGYTTIDKIAAELLPAGPVSAARYGVLESLFTAPYLWLALRLGHQRLSQSDGKGWKWAAVAAFFIFTAYWLILWAYQLSPYASYISALRQFSIVIGVVTAAIILHEPARGMRIGAAVVITAGILCISFAR